MLLKAQDQYEGRLIFVQMAMAAAAASRRGKTCVEFAGGSALAEVVAPVFGTMR
jgi:hypothetical protein